MFRFFVSLIAAASASLFPTAAAVDLRLVSFASPTLISQVQLLRLDENLRQAMTTGDFVGLAVSVVQDGEVRLIRTYGETETGNGEPVTPDTVFRIASLSKGFASSMVGLAVSEGRLSLDAPVTSFAPELALPAGGEKLLTLASLLSQRTGLPPNAYDNLLEDGVAPAKILPMYRKVKPTCAVSSCYSYQNVTYDLAGRALANAYSEAYSQLVEERLFAPLGMTTASYGIDGLRHTGNWARPHTRDRQRDPELPPNPWRPLEVKLPYYDVPAAGGVNASIRDMTQWLNAQLGHAPDVLPTGVLQLIHTPQVSTPTETRRMREAMPAMTASQYAYGWRVYDYAGREVIAHGGSVDGYGAHIMFLPDADTGIVVLSNSRSKRMWAIAPMFMDLTLGLPPKDWLALRDTKPVEAVPVQDGPAAVP